MSYGLWSTPIWIIGIIGIIWAICIHIISLEKKQKRWISLLDNDTVLILGTVALIFFYVWLTTEYLDIVRY